MVASIPFTRCLCYKPERFRIISLSLPTQAKSKLLRSRSPLFLLSLNFQQLPIKTCFDRLIFTRLIQVKILNPNTCVLLFRSNLVRLRSNQSKLKVNTTKKSHTIFQKSLQQTYYLSKQVSTKQKIMPIVLTIGSRLLILKTASRNPKFIFLQN